MEDVAPQLGKWFAERYAMESLRNRLAFIAEKARLREAGLDEGDAFKNLWPEAYARLMARGKEARDWLKETGDEGILGGVI